MNTLKLQYQFDLNHSITCGQFFQWRPEGNGYIIQTGENLFYVEQRQYQLWYRYFRGEVDKKFLHYFFRLDDNIPGIFHQWKNDEMLQDSYQRYKGLRIFRQDPWECLVSFLCSAASNIPRITKNLRTLSQRYGVQKVTESGDYFFLPTAEQIASVTIDDLYDVGLGFRAKYLWKTAKIIQKGFDLDRLRHLAYPVAKAQLKELPGVGDKIADCVLLFSLDHLEAFPTDTWIIQVLREHYFPNASRNATKLASLAREKFGKNGGYAQQYLYHYARKERRPAPKLGTESIP